MDDSKVIGDAAVKFVRAAAAAGKLFLATVWFHTPHQNFAASDLWLDLYSGPAYANSTLVDKLYYADISGMDFQIGEIRRALRAAGVAEDTAVFFTADNGPEHNTPGSTAGMKGRKRDLTEGGVRNPGLLEWPAKIVGNHWSAFPAKVYDYLPTVLDTFSVPSANPGWALDGVSLVPVVERIGAGEPAPRRGTPLVWETQHAFGGKADAVGHNSLQLAIMDNDLKLYGSRADPSGAFAWSLYNISADRTETHDVIAAHPAAARALNASLQGWILSVARSRTAAENGCDRWDPMHNATAAAAAAAAG